MKKILGAVGLSLLFAGSAVAADMRAPARMPAKAPVAAPVAAVASWTGCYLGAHVGGLKVETQLTGVDIPGVDRGSHDGTGLIAGGQIGCDFQTGQFVFGILADGSWSNADSSGTDLFNPDFTNRTDVRSLGSVSGRIGVAWQRALIYALGGFAWERDRFTTFDIVTGETGGQNVTLRGWTVGGGLEFLIAPNWSMFGQYNYYRFNDKNVTYVFPVLPTSIDSASVEKHAFRVGLNWRFGGGGAVVARY